jgi:hypothetical protein
MNDSSTDPADALSASSLLMLIRGHIQRHWGATHRKAAIQLLRELPGGGVLPMILFSSESRGLFNTLEEAKFEVSANKIAFSRNGYIGEWKLNEERLGKTQISLFRRWFHWGRSETRMKDGTVVQVLMPIVGPSLRQVIDCACTAVIGRDTRIRMFLARPAREKQFLFDHSQAQSLRQLSNQSRAVLLGEFLRVLSIYSFGV